MTTIQPIAASVQSVDDMGSIGGRCLPARRLPTRSLYSGAIAAILSVSLVGCATTPDDPRRAQAEARCNYESRMVTGPRALTSGYAAVYQVRLYYSCMSAAGY